MDRRDSIGCGWCQPLLSRRRLLLGRQRSGLETCGYNQKRSYSSMVMKTIAHSALMGAEPWLRELIITVGGESFATFLTSFPTMSTFGPSAPISPPCPHPCLITNEQYRIPAHPPINSGVTQNQA